MPTQTVCRRHFVAIGIFVAGALSAALPAATLAYDSYYSCTLKPVGVWCDGRANGTYDGQHSYDYNAGWYSGPWDNTVTACQRLYRPSTGATRSGSSCGLNYSENYYGPTSCICYDAEARQYSGGPHSVEGHGQA